MTDIKINQEIAAEDFDRWIETIGIDVTDLDDEDAADVSRHRRRIMNAIEAGNAEVSADGASITYRPTRSDGVESITFHEPTGEAWLAIDRKKKNHSIAQLHAVLASVTRQPPVVFSKLAAADYKFCQSVVSLFLG